MSQYTFGDTNLAARRLRIISEVFRESTASALSLVAGLEACLSVDLGCGPGYSTRLLAEAIRCERIVGLDSSPHFIEIAGRSGTERVSFQAHDVRVTPFPVGPSDLLFCRLLLSHLPNPEKLLLAWSSQLAIGGLLLIEELEAIRTAQPVLARYLSIVARMIEDEGADLFVGPRLASLSVAPRLAKKDNRVYSMRVSNRDAASMFSLNVLNWRDRRFVQDNYSSEEIGQLEAGLQEIARSTSEASDIEWELRHLVFEKR